MRVSGIPDHIKHRGLGEKSGTRKASYLTLLRALV